MPKLTRKKEIWKARSAGGRVRRWGKCLHFKNGYIDLQVTTTRNYEAVAIVEVVTMPGSAREDVRVVATKVSSGNNSERKMKAWATLTACNYLKENGLT